MSDYSGRGPAGSEEAGVNTIAVIFLGLGLLFGWEMGESRARDDARDWAIKATRRCEASYRTAGFSSVTDCLQEAIEGEQEAELQQLQDNGPYDPKN